MAAVPGWGVACVERLLEEGQADSTGATQLALIGGGTGTLPTEPGPLPIGYVATNSDGFFGTVSSSAMSLTC